MDSTLVLDGDTNTESQRLADGDPTVKLLLPVSGPTRHMDSER